MTIAEMNSIVTKYLPLIEKLANKRRMQLPAWCDLDMMDLVTVGAMALRDSLTRFDPARGVRFTTFASRRVLGAMMDAVREVDWVPRMQRNREKLYTEAVQSLTAKLYRSPTEDEVLEHLGGGRTAEKIVRDGSTPVQRESIDGIIGLHGERDHLMRDTLEAPVPRPDEPIIQQDEFERMISSVHGRQRRAMSLYYRDEYTMKETGKILGMSESRVSQLISSALQIIRARYQFKDLPQHNSQKPSENEDVQNC